MRIVVTGCTALHCGNTRNYLSTMELVVKGLRLLGHSVDQRAVVPMSDLDDYDFAVIGLYKFDALNVTAAWYRFGALWAASQLPHAVVIDDHNWGATSRCWKWFWRPNMAGKKTLEWMETLRKHKVDRVLDPIVEKWKSSMDRVLFPIFNWGDGSLLTDIHPVDDPIFWDPSPLVDLPKKKTHWALKRRQWVVASLQQIGKYIDDLRLGWPLIEFFRHGAHRSGSTWGRVDEDAVIAQYDVNWGVVSFPYRHAGSGWWRSRFNFCAAVKSVMLADLCEVKPLGPAFDVKARDVESMSKSELNSLAEDQHAALAQHELDVAGCLTELERLIS